jgi:hypothetical protein
MGLVLGFDCVLSRNTGTFASPTWNEVGNCQDVEVGLSKETAEATIRGAGGWKLKKGTLKDGEVQFTMIYDTADADFTAFLDAFLDNTTIDVLAADDSGNGFRAVMDVLDAKQSQKLKEFVSVTFKLAPTYNNSGAAGVFAPPQWIST